MFQLILFIAVWGCIHSLLASLRFKDFLCRTAGNEFMKFYRLLYNIFAAVSLLPVLYLMVVLPDKPFYQIASPWNYLMRAGQGMSVLFLLLAAWQTDLLAFIGLRQLLEEQKSSLVITGFYRFVRHPL